MSKTIRKPRSAHTDTKDAAARRRAAHTARMKREKAIIKVISQTYYGDHQK
jgi:hypothetical protein